MKETSEDDDNSSITDSYSIGSSTNDLDECLYKKFSHVCIVTYRTKDGEVCGVDLSYIGQDCFAIPSILGKIYGTQTRRLDLSFNSIRSLENLEMFPSMEELILDNNDLNDLVSFVPLPHLHTLSLNKNHFLDLETLLKQLTICYPELTYLSLLGNPACPDQLSNTEKDEEDYQKYRYYILHQIPKLNFLDSTPVKSFEKSEAKRIGGFMKVSRPKVEIAHEASDDMGDTRYSPLPSENKREGTHRGSHALCVSVIMCLSSVISEENYYRAAVFEIVQFADMSFSVPEIIKKNLDTYQVAANAAAQNGADIIVFPEWGLFSPLNASRNLVFNIAEDTPDPKTKVVCPCNISNMLQNRPILTKLSCLAKHNGLFVVANVIDRKKCDLTETCYADDVDSCTSTVKECPDDGYIFYNTNVVFNREGTLIAKYYKRHLYFEPNMKIPTFPKDVYFQTDFGNFTTVICFDLFFEEAVKAVKKPGVANLAYPTYWFDHLPYIFFSTSFQQAWAMTNRINLLAANVHDPRTGTLGSGIYSAHRGALIYTHNPDGRSKLLISNVPKFIDDDTEDNFVLNTKQFVIENDIAKEVEKEEESNFKNECVTSVLGETTNVLADYRCHPAHADHFEFFKLEGKEGGLEFCSNTFCCSLSYQASSMDENYFLGITGKNLNFFTANSYGIEACFLARCDALNGAPCMNYILKSGTVFQKVQLKGNFSTEHVYPFAVNSGVRLTDTADWTFDGKSEISYHNWNKNFSLIFFGLKGRIYDRDYVSIE